MEEATRYPIDFDAVEKGDVIPRKRLTEILGERAGTYSFQYKLVGFMSDLQRQLWDRDKPFTVRYHRGDVMVLSDSEASAYNQERFRKHCRGLLKTHRQLCAVDVAKLDTDKAANHDRAIALQGRTLAATVETRVLQPVAYRRAMAMLPGPRG